MYYVYVLYNKDCGKFYIGQTIDLEQRTKLHNEKLFKNSYTSRFEGLWSVIYSERYTTRSESLRREKELKSFQGRVFVKSIVSKNVI